MAALSLACGASPRMVHQSSEYFERCHAADLDPDRSVEQRTACWTAWLEHYAGYQKAERRAYAEQRVAALARGEVVPPLPDVTTYTAAFLSTAAEEVAPEHGDANDANDANEANEASNEAGTEEPAADSGDEPDAHGADVDPTPRATVDADPQVRAPVPDPTPRTTPRPVTVPSSDPCVHVCAPRRTACMTQCTRRGADCVTACDAEHRICLRGCF